MPEETISFEHALEADIKTLAAEINYQRENPEMKNRAEQELIKEAIRAFPESKNQPHAATPAPQVAVNPASPLPAYAQTAPPEIKLEIEYLLDIALKKGMGAALTESQKSPAFVQDAFHDALAGKLYPELQKRGIVK
jgi:hypothetical protein